MQFSDTVDIDVPEAADTSDSAANILQASQTAVKNLVGSPTIQWPMLGAFALGALFGRGPAGLVLAAYFLLRKK